MSSHIGRGYLFGILAYLCWGFFPAFFKSLQPSGALEILAHRIVWSLLFIALVLTVLRRWRPVSTLTRSPKSLAAIGLAAVLIGINWGTYIYGVNTDRVVETSLGYFITPLTMVLLGLTLFGERLRRTQWVALGLGAVAVVVLTVDYGRLPYIALVLACSFSLYGFVKKRLGLPPADAMFVESLALALPAIAFLFLLGGTGKATVGQVSPGHTVLIVLLGAVSAIPLMLFAAAANRIPMTGLGIVQYIGPVIQLCLGVLAFHEPMPPVRIVGFALVWVALAVFSWDALRQARTAAHNARDSAAKDSAATVSDEAQATV